ncbi:MAG: methyltransferase, partial [Planctomycetota bacterium]
MPGAAEQQADDLILPAAAWSAALAAAEAAGDYRPTWAYTWPAGERLAADLPQLNDCRGRQVCDLGCGRGVLGLQALRSAAASVVFADASPHPLAWVDAVLQANAWQDRGRTLVHRWGTALPPCDLVLGGDILYRPECFVDLLDSLAAAARQGAEILLSDPRTELEQELPGLAASRGLSW